MSYEKVLQRGSFFSNAVKNLQILEVRESDPLGGGISCLIITSNKFKKDPSVTAIENKNITGKF